MHIQINQGLDIPIEGKPSLQKAIEKLPQPKELSLNLNPFPDIKFKLMAKVGDVVKEGQPLVYDKECPSRVFVSPASGRVKEVRRGLKRRLLDIVITVEGSDSIDYGTFNIDNHSQKELIERLLEGGAFSLIKMRPFNCLAHPEHLPKSIFVKALESAPFVAPAEMQIQNHEEDFKTGLKALKKLTDGQVHLIHQKDSDFSLFKEDLSTQTHTAEGPHPIASSSLHIHNIDPIEKSDQVVWTVSSWDVVAIGYLLNKGRVYTDQIISIAGNGILEEKRGFFEGKVGHPVGALIANRTDSKTLRFISGNPLTGHQVEVDGFLQFGHRELSVIPENTEREFLHFFRLGLDKYSSHRAYFSGWLSNESREYEFTTTQHGEDRAFIDGEIYQKVMPMQIPVMQLVKAVMAEDFELAEQLGLLEVASEDFALSTFICPSKVEMVDIMEKGLQAAAKDSLHY